MPVGNTVANQSSNVSCQPIGVSETKQYFENSLIITDTTEIIYCHLHLHVKISICFYLNQIIKSIILKIIKGHLHSIIFYPF